MNYNKGAVKMNKTIYLKTPSDCKQIDGDYAQAQFHPDLEILDGWFNNMDMTGIDLSHLDFSNIKVIVESFCNNTNMRFSINQWDLSNVKIIDTFLTGCKDRDIDASGLDLTNLEIAYTFLSFTPYRYKTPVIPEGCLVVDVFSNMENTYPGQDDNYLTVVRDGEYYQRMRDHVWSLRELTLRPRKVIDGITYIRNGFDLLELSADASVDWGKVRMDPDKTVMSYFVWGGSIWTDIEPLIKDLDFSNIDIIYSSFASTDWDPTVAYGWDLTNVKMMIFSFTYLPNGFQQDRLKMSDDVLNHDSFIYMGG